MVKLRKEAGWIGSFTREQADGHDVLPNGTRIVKASAQTGIAAGTLGVVLGSVRVDEASGALVLGGDGPLSYFVAWDTYPRHAMIVRAFRVAKVDSQG